MAGNLRARAHVRRKTARSGLKILYFSRKYQLSMYGLDFVVILSLICYQSQMWLFSAAAIGRLNAVSERSNAVRCKKAVYFWA